MALLLKTAKKKEKREREREREREKNARLEDAMLGRLRLSTIVT